MDEGPGVGGADEDVALGGLDEAVVHRLVDEGQQEVVVPVHVQEPHRLAVDAQLGPRDHLQELFQRPVPAWERDEGVGVARHLRLALVHARHGTHLAHRLPGDLQTR